MKNKMILEGAIFDLDGTIFDSMAIWDTIPDDYLRTLGKEPRENLKETFKEMSLIQSAEYYQEHYDVKLSVEEIIAGVNKLVESYYIEAATLKECAAEYLKMLKDHGVKLCVATAIDCYLAEAALIKCGVREYFDGIVSCQDVKAGKDRPDVYLKAREIIGTKLEKTAVYEDAIHGLMTAKQAGFITVGIYEEEEENQEKVREIADCYIDSYREALRDIY